MGGVLGPSSGLDAGTLAAPGSPVLGASRILPLRQPGFRAALPPAWAVPVNDVFHLPWRWHEAQATAEQG